MRKDEQFTNIILTGASGGLGRSLTRALARPDRRLLLAGRDVERLDAAVAEAEALGAKAERVACPLSDREAYEAALLDFDRRHPVDLLIVGAGVKTGNTGGVEPPNELLRVIDVNLTASLATVQAFLPRMISRQRGQIALMSSLAAVSPHADLLSYSATKAGVRAYGIALRRNLAGTGVDVSIITPGFIDTPMTDRHLGPAPFLLSADRAAAIIVSGLARRRPEIAFPRRLVIAAWAERLLPHALASRIHQRMRARILPDEDEQAARGLPPEHRTREPQAHADGKQD